MFPPSPFRYSDYFDLHLMMIPICLGFYHKLHLRHFYLGHFDTATSERAFKQRVKIELIMSSPAKRGRTDLVFGKF